MRYGPGTKRRRRLRRADGVRVGLLRARRDDDTAARARITACTSKERRFRTLLEADVAALAAAQRSGHQNIVGYRCRFCSHYHIGHRR